jgi:biotin operon repressor
MATSAVTAIKSRLDEVQGELEKLNKDFEAAKKALAEHSKPLKDERSGLRKALEALGKITGETVSTNGHADAGDQVTDEALIEAVNAGGETPRKTPEIAESLGVGSRKIARKLKKLADEGKIFGNKDDGYAAVFTLNQVSEPAKAKTSKSAPSEPVADDPAE